MPEPVMPEPGAPEPGAPEAATPEAATPEAFGGVGELLAAAVADGGIPGAVAAAGLGGATLAQWVVGEADTMPGLPMHARTVFDLASLTKVVATTTVTLSLVAAGRLDLDGVVPLPDYPSLRTVTVRQLLAHTSGLPSSVEFYRWCGTRDQLLSALRATPLLHPPGSVVAYSDLGFMALGELVTAVTGEPLDRAFARRVATPLGLAQMAFNPAAGPFAATERAADGVPYRGIVHDENARVLGGVAGHAGLFAPLADLARFAAWWVGDGEGPVPKELRAAATACQTATADGGCRGLGWVRQGDRFDILGPRWPPGAVSHTGFTGTSLALDPDSGAWLVLLTNAVHFGRDATAIKKLRRQVTAAAASALF